MSSDVFRVHEETLRSAEFLYLNYFGFDMKYAYLATGWIKCSVEEYVEKFGPKLNAQAKERTRPMVCCVACNQKMHAVGETGPLRDAIWSHPPVKVWCPLKQNSGKPYEILEPQDVDEEAGRALRASFFLNWRLHWGHVLEITKLCDIETFIGFIKHADSKRLWCRAGLEEWLVCYIFLATCDFPPPKGQKGKTYRPYWVRCRFDARVRTSEDLWIRVNEDWKLIVAEYRAPSRGAEPQPHHLIKATGVTPDRGFLGRIAPGGNPYQVTAMKTAFPVELP